MCGFVRHITRCISIASGGTFLWQTGHFISEKNFDVESRIRQHHLTTVSQQQNSQTQYSKFYNTMFGQC